MTKIISILIGDFSQLKALILLNSTSQWLFFNCVVCKRILKVIETPIFMQENMWCNLLSFSSPLSFFMATKCKH